MRNAHRDARKLSPSAQQELRFRAVTMVRSGMTQRHVAKLLDVSRVAVNQWCRREETEGLDSLKARKRGNPTGPRLRGAQAATICNIIRDKCPDQIKLPYALWTREAVQRLIFDRFGIHLALRTIGNYLARWGFTPQKPAVRVYEATPRRCGAGARSTTPPSPRAPSVKVPASGGATKPACVRGITPARATARAARRR
jgi:transposase